MDRKRPKCSKAPWIAVIAVVAVAVVIGGVYTIQKRNTKKMQLALNVNTIYPGITIEGVDVGGLSKADAFSKLEAEVNDALRQKQVTMTYGEESWGISFGTMGANYDLQAAVTEAYQLGRESEASLKERYAQYEEMQKNGYALEASLSYDKDKVRQQVEAITTPLEREAKDATMTRSGGAFQITDSVDGFTVHTDEAVNEVCALVEQAEAGTVALTGESTPAEVTREELESSTDLLGTFSTSYTGNDSLGRNINLIVGCEKINGTILAPGEVFSMNAGLGDQTYENGFRDAAVIVNGKIEDGIAGGVCQVTTTLYNAVVKAELEVVERSNHSLPVSYVPLGHDAAIAGDYIDFKFKNNTDYPVYLEAYAGGGQVVTKLYGHETRDPSRKVELDAEVDETIPKPAEKITEDPTKPEGYREVTYTGKVGYRVSTYLVVYENGKQISRERFNRSTYKAVADEVTIGTGPAEETEETTPAGSQMGESIFGD